MKQIQKNLRGNNFNNFPKFQNRGGYNQNRRGNFNNRGGYRNNRGGGRYKRGGNFQGQGKFQQQFRGFPNQMNQMHMMMNMQNPQFMQQNQQNNMQGINYNMNPNQIFSGQGIPAQFVGNHLTVESENIKEKILEKLRIENYEQRKEEIGEVLFYFLLKYIPAYHLNENTSNGVQSEDFELASKITGRLIEETNIQNILQVVENNVIFYNEMKNIVNMIMSG